MRYANLLTPSPTVARRDHVLEYIVDVDGRKGNRSSQGMWLIVLRIEPAFSEYENPSLVTFRRFFFVERT